MAGQSITIRYGDIGRVAHELVAIKGNIESVIREGIPLAGHEYLWFKQIGNTQSEIREALEGVKGVAESLEKVVQACEDTEYNVKKALADFESPEGYNIDHSSVPPSFADEYYAGVDAANEAAAEEEKKEEERAAKKEAFLAFLATYYPEAYAAYMQKVHEAEEAEWLEAIKDDPELSWLYDLIMAEKEKQRKAAEAAEQAAEALEEAGKTPGADGKDALDSLGSGLGSDLGGGGGGGGLGDLGSGLGSDFGGGGGLGDLGSGWESDLLDDAVDSGELLDAGGALDEIAAADNPAATDTGMNAAGGDVALDEAEAGVLGAFGEKLASLASAYGMQAAAVAGAGVALYATREQTTEMVAHVAEFVSTRCKPFASDVMDQVSGAAKKTRVNLSRTKSRVVTPKRDEEAGDLIA